MSHDVKAKVRSDVLSFLKDSRAEAGHVFHAQSFFAKYLRHYNPKEKGVLDEVLSDLSSERFFEARVGQFFLTSTGFDNLNPSSPQEVVRRVKKDILSWFRTARSDVGHALNAKAFSLGPAASYTSKEKIALSEAVSQLAAEGLVSEEKDGRILLTAKGVDAIY
jgi:hypothetical protein